MVGPMSRFHSQGLPVLIILVRGLLGGIRMVVLTQTSCGGCSAEHPSSNDDIYEKSTLQLS